MGVQLQSRVDLFKIKLCVLLVLRVLCLWPPFITWGSLLASVYFGGSIHPFRSCTLIFCRMSSFLLALFFFFLHLQANSYNLQCGHRTNGTPPNLFFICYNCVLRNRIDMDILMWCACMKCSHSWKCETANVWRFFFLSFKLVFFNLIWS